MFNDCLSVRGRARASRRAERALRSAFAAALAFAGVLALAGVLLALAAALAFAGILSLAGMLARAVVELLNRGVETDVAVAARRSMREARCADYHARDCRCHESRFHCRILVLINCTVDRFYGGVGQVVFAPSGAPERGTVEEAARREKSSWSSDARPGPASATHARSAR